MLFALFIARPSSARDDHGIRREWIRWVEESGEPVIHVNFQYAAKVSLAQVLDMYKKLDSPLRKLGIVPVE